MKKIILKTGIIVLFIVLVMGSCTDAKRSKLMGLGSKFKVEMLNCDGSVARTWVSSGKVSSEARSDGYYFEDEKTGKLIEVTGRLVITRQ